MSLFGLPAGRNRPIIIQDATGEPRFGGAQLGARVEDLSVEDRRDGAYGDAEEVRQFILPRTATAEAIRVRDLIVLAGAELYEVRTIEVQSDAARDSVALTATARKAA